MRKLLFIFAAMLLSSIGLHAETTVIPHPFTIHDVGGGDRQVVYFSTDEPTKHTWQESFIENPQILSKLEWEYLLNDRKINNIAAANFRGWAQLLDEDSDTKVKNAYAVLLPDDWAEMYDFHDGAWHTRETEPKIVFNIGPTFDNNPLKDADKAALQQAGAVFLPCDISTSEGVYANGQYWTNTKENLRGIYYAYFSTSSTTSPTPVVKINEDGKAEEERYVLKAIREVTITLDENEDNTDLLNIWKTNGQQVNVQLVRSLVSGMYNTFCLPFDLTEKEVKETFGAEAKVAKFTNGTLSEDKQTLEIVFESCTTIEAGVPYLIEPTQGMTNPTFYNRVIQKTSADGENFSPQGGVEYLGIINPYHIPDGDMKYLFLQANNNLIWSKAGDASFMKGMRGYFYVPDMPDMPTNCPARLSVRHTPQTPTELESVNNDENSKFIIQNSKFIINGQFVIVKDGKAYNALGARLVD